MTTRMPLSFTLLLLLLLYTSICKADLKLSDNTTLTEDQLNRIQHGLKKLEAKKIFYHWTKPETGIRWTLQGYIDPGEVNFYNTPTGDRQVHGAGIYLAESPTSSSYFGDYAITFEIPAGTPVYDDAIVTQIVGKALTNDEKSVLGTRINFVRNASSDWWLTNHPSNVNHIKYGGISSPQARFKQDSTLLKNEITLFKGVKEGVRTNPSGQYLYSLMHLVDYMDGVSFMRAMKVNPSNPWNEFEPERFDAFKNTTDAIYERIAAGKKLTVGTDLAKDAWVTQQINLLGELNHSLGAHHANPDKPWRNEGIRAGGTLEGNNFDTMTKEYLELSKNPYLEVEKVFDAANKEFLVHYFYPDALHFKHLEGKISKELFKKLSSTSKDELMKNSSLRQELNQQIIKELLQDLFSRNYGKTIDYRTAEGTQFLRDLVSIHPFEDLNGRTSRLYFKAIHLEAGIVPTPAYFNGDFDLVKSPEFFRDILVHESNERVKLLQSFLEETVTATGEKRLPDYGKLKALDGKLASNLHFLGLPSDKQVNVSPEEWELIKQRRFNDAFDKMTNLEWRNKDNYARFKQIDLLKNDKNYADFLKTMQKNHLLKNLSSVEANFLLDKIANKIPANFQKEYFVALALDTDILLTDQNRNTFTTLLGKIDNIDDLVNTLMIKGRGVTVLSVLESTPSEKDIYPALVKLLKSPSNEVKTKSIQILMLRLSRAKDGQDVSKFQKALSNVDDLLRLLDDPALSDDTRMQIIRIVKDGRLSGADVWNKLITFTEKTKTNNLKANALYVLGSTVPERDRDLLIQKWRSSPSRDVRMLAISFADYVPNDVGAKIAFSMITDDVPDIAKSAITTFTNKTGGGQRFSYKGITLTPKLKAVVSQLINGQDTTLKITASQMVANLGIKDPQLNKAIAKILIDAPNHYYIDSVIDSLSKIAPQDPEVHKILIQVAQQDNKNLSPKVKNLLRNLKLRSGCLSGVLSAFTI